MLNREIANEIKKRLGSELAIVIMGARQVGKTTLLHSILDDRTDVYWMQGDERSTQNFFEDISPEKFQSYIAGKQIFVLDEAQHIANIGLKLKVLHDYYKGKMQIIATGSSSFDLANEINEPMTGRKWEYKMFPLTFWEMVQNIGLAKEKANLENRLLYGYYPAIISNPGDERRLLSNLTNDNLFKDIYKWEDIRKPWQLEDLLKALAFQIGSVINLSELSNLIGLDLKTVKKYIRALEQNYIIFRLGSYSRNLRSELRSSEKIYFYDTGIRNSLIGNFSAIDSRTDIGHLFENFIIAEFAKAPELFTGSFGYFWRNKQKQEIDFVQEKNGMVFAHEIKWNPKANVKFANSFVDKYEPVLNTINSKNYSNTLLNSEYITNTF